MKILLIEDDLSILSFVKKGLKEMNHTVDSFSNGNDISTIPMEEYLKK